jgi:hypothetical protein
MTKYIFLGEYIIQSREKGGTMAKISRGGRMTAAKKRAANTAGGKGKVSARPAGKRIMRT